jgi:hypothetical protein
MKKYFAKLFENYSNINITKYAVILATGALILDILNLPTKYLQSIDRSLLYVLLGASLVITILITVEFNIVQMFKISMINYLDVVSVVIVYSSALYVMSALMLNKLSHYKLVISICLTILSVSIMIIRGLKFKSKIKVSDDYKTNVLDLLDVYNGKFEITNNKMILLREKDVDYDLLQRKSIINKLFNAIIRCNPDGKFVISLEGKWGSGKTTILNNIKKKLIDFDSNIVIIDEFDPWIYSDQESLLYNMFDIILKKTGFKYSTLSMKHMISNVCDTIFGIKKEVKIFKSISRKTNEIAFIKTQINDYLKLCGKKVVFYIDNIDRAESKNVILLFKLVGNVFGFERVTYILSFDDERVKKIFDNDLNIDYQYLKKIIQMQIRVPEVDRTVLEGVFKVCMKNLALAYGETTENLYFYNTILDCICTKIKDIRDLKRFINSVISSTFAENSYLNKKDLLAIEYLRLYNFDLYNSIYQNRKFYISHDKIVDRDVYMASFDKKEFNKRAKLYYDELFSGQENIGYIDLLSELFPYVKKYKDKQELEYDGYFSSNNDYQSIVRDRRICSGKYFDLYFTYTENDYLQIHRLVTSFIESMNTSSCLGDRESIFIKFIESMHTSYHKEIFELMQLYIEDLNDDATNDIIYILFNNITIIDDSSIFLGLNARGRLGIIIWELLQKNTEKQYDDFLKAISKEYAKIEIISTILYWFDHDREGKNKIGRKEKWQDLYKNMGDEILKESINIYDDKYYSHKNIWGLARIYKDDKEKIKKYTSVIISEKDIFRLIYDIVGLSFGAKYNYSISKKNLESLTTEENIDKILEKALPCTDDEKFIFDVYEKYKKGINDNWGEGGVTTDYEKKLTL